MDKRYDGGDGDGDDSDNDAGFILFKLQKIP